MNQIMETTKTAAASITQPSKMSEFQLLWARAMAPRTEAAMADGSWRIGFTKFAARMLGELVEFGFEVKPGDPVKVGQVIGWVEAFKAMSDVFAVVEGEFAGVNEALQANTELAQTDPYGAGWLYAARGTPEPNAVDVHGYVGILDGAIDKIQDKTP